MMKKIFTILIALLVLASCTKNIEKDGAPIVLSSGVLSKAPITSGVTFTGSIAGWESAATVDYTANTSWITSASVTADDVTAKNVTLTDKQYYNPSEATKTYMKAWYPTGTVSAGKVTFTGSDNKTDGTMDVLFAPAIFGDNANATGKVLSFAHTLSQINFMVVAGANMTDIPTLTSITIRNVELPTGIDLSTDALIYAPAADLPIPGITAGNIAINTTAAVAGSPVMIKPLNGNTFVVSVVTSDNTYADAIVTISDADFVVGKAYTVTLTFKSTNEIALTATVAAWKTGSGSAVIE